MDTIIAFRPNTVSDGGTDWGFSRPQPLFWGSNSQQAMIGPSLPDFAQDKPTQIAVRVDGLSCPFCAYGLEKKLKRLEGTEEVRIDIDRSVALIKLAEGKTIEEADLKEAVLDTGFTPKEITYRP